MRFAKAKFFLYLVGKKTQDAEIKILLRNYLKSEFKSEKKSYFIPPFSMIESLKDFELRRLSC